jgi:hypothetical protein
MLAATATAEAAQRYASPGGTGEKCSKQEPCSLQIAIGKAGNHDEVIVGAGTFALGSTPIDAGGNGVEIHGDFGGPAPKIEAAYSKGTPIDPGSEGRMSYLDITNIKASAQGANCHEGGRLERLQVTVVGPNSLGIELAQDCIVRDTVVRALGTEAFGVFAGTFDEPSTGFLRNVTAIASGLDSIGLLSEFTGASGSYTLDANNVIAGGELSDLDTAAQATASANIVVSHSNFDLAAPGASVIDAGGNESAPPLFVDAAGGNYREAPGSPTIDAGTGDLLLGALDPDGLPRTVGPAPDIGAFEFAPSAASAAPAQILSLALSPKSFRAGSSGGAVASVRGKAKGPVGTNVRFSLSAAGEAQFSVEKLSVRRKCVKEPPSNHGKKKCSKLKKLKHGFTVSGNAGRNSFKFTGRLGKRALAPGRYYLVGAAGAAVRRAAFKIVR